MTTVRRVVGAAYRRVYDAPIPVRVGDRGRVTRRDGDAPGWVWVEHEVSGRAGWTPLAFLRRLDRTARVVFTRDYDALELSVAAGEVASAGETVDGSLWCEAGDGAPRGGAARRVPP